MSVPHLQSCAHSTRHRLPTRHEAMIQRLPTLLRRRAAACAAAAASLFAASSLPLPAETRAFDPATLAEMDAEIDAAIKRKEIPGAVLHLEWDGLLYAKSYGCRMTDPKSVPMTQDTLFDLASLTKVVATTPAVLKLAERGKISLDAPVRTYISEFTGEGREKITVRQLLTHTSGLPPGIPRTSPWSGFATGIRKACTEPLRHPPGSSFLYSDINFILLGEIVQRVSGQRLDWFLRSTVFDPCGMTETYFRPGAKVKYRVAPTTREADGLVWGVVHDPTSRLMGGVTGHAGCFSTAANLAKYARMLLRGGVLPSGKRLFKPETIAQISTVQTAAEIQAKRGLGWDIDSRYSEPRGEIFPAGESFGHTGWTGTSLWILPKQKAFIILLTNRNHPSETGRVKELRGKIGTLAAKAMGLRKPDAPPTPTPQPQPPGAKGEPGPQGAADATAVIAAQTLNGIDSLKTQQFAPLRGLRLGLITNHTGLSRDGESTIDLLHQAEGVKLLALFSPEHGIRGQLDQKTINDSKDEKTGLPVYSLYGKSREPSAAQLKGLDALVFDIQDIGTRFYTYISTMKLCMHAAADAGIAFFVLDRINPINGVKVEGPVRDGPEDFTACHSIPVRHGMTAGELARMFAAEGKWKLDLRVIPVTRWTRSHWQDQSGLRWINPSPNMRSLAAAALYPGVGLLEMTNVSVGRGTATPFEVFGAPWIDSPKLLAGLNQHAALLPGVKFHPATFTPTASVFAGQKCQGIRMEITDRDALPSVRLGVVLAAVLRGNHPEQFEIDKMSRLLAHPATLSALKKGVPPQEIIARWQPGLDDFQLRRKKFLLYDAGPP